MAASAAGVGALVHAEDDPVVAGAEADEVALLDLDLVRLHDPHQLVVADKTLAAAAMMLEIDHDAAALHAVRRHVVDRQLERPDMLAALDGAAVAIVHGPDDVLAGAVAVVEDDLGPAVAVGVEQLPDMGEAVPLRRVLQRHLDDVVADHVDQFRVLAGERVGDVGHPVALVGNQARRMAARVDHRAARIIERQAEAENPSFLHLGDAFEHLFRGQQIEPADLILGTPISPSRAWRAALPARVLGHRFFLLVIQIFIILRSGL